MSASICAAEGCNSLGGFRLRPSSKYCSIACGLAAAKRAEALASKSVADQGIVQSLQTGEVTQSAADSHDVKQLLEARAAIEKIDTELATVEETDRQIQQHLVVIEDIDPAASASNGANAGSFRGAASQDCPVCGQLFAPSAFIGHIEDCYNKLQLTLVKANLDPSMKSKQKQEHIALAATQYTQANMFGKNQVTGTKRRICGCLLAPDGERTKYCEQPRPCEKHEGWHQLHSERAVARRKRLEEARQQAESRELRICACLAQRHASDKPSNAAN